MKKINLIIAGFQKAGTTSLKNYLGKHPNIFAHTQKEMTFFSLEEEFNKGENEAFKRYYKGLQNEQYTLAKHATLIRHEESIKRLHNYNPQARIIICLRDPVERAYSSYLMEQTNGNQTQDFSKVVKEAFENSSKGISDWHYNVFIKFGEYSIYIETLLKFFPVSQIYVLQIENLKSEPLTEINAIFNWLGLHRMEGERGFKYFNSYRTGRHPLLGKIINTILKENSLFKRIMKKIIPLNTQERWGQALRKTNSKKAIKEPMSEITRSFLKAYYEKPNRHLEELMNNSGLNKIIKY